MKTRTLLYSSVCWGLSVCWACQREPAPVETPPEPAPPSTPDRLRQDETLPEAETAFGLPIPKGMKLVRHFNDSAYFAGKVDMDSVLAHLRQHLRAEPAQLLTQGALFPRAYIVGDTSQRLFRIEASKSARGTQVRIQEITPPPPALTGLSEAELWRQAGRKPDGTPLDPNQLY